MSYRQASDAGWSNLLSKQSVHQQDVHNKLALPLWVRMQHCEPSQWLDVMLTLADDLRITDIQDFERAGLIVEDAYDSRWHKQVPGRITRDALERNLLGCPQVAFVEGWLGSAS